MMIGWIAKGYITPFFGAGVNLSNRPPGASFSPKQHLPNAAELSESIAKEFNYPETWGDKENLPRVSWHASTVVGKGFLYQHLHDIFKEEYPPTAVHEFFAQLPKKLAAKDYPNRHQLIITTNYDAVLESAFDDAGAPYDVFTYVAHTVSKDDRQVGKFRYIPHRGEPRIIYDPNERGLSIERTVILKIHGAVDRTNWKGSSFVVTEDDYIDYLARMNIPSYQIPTVLMQEMLDRRFLFLGYSLGDWNLRVLLNSIRESRLFNDTSWAVMDKTKEWDETYWRKNKVELMKLPLSDYVAALNEQLDALPDFNGGATP
jgi:hypothetical protein